MTAVKTGWLPLKRPRQRRAEITFDSILDAAARLLAERGFVEISTNHIAEQAGVAIGSLYEYFPDKETIVAELTRRTVREMMVEITAGLDTAAALGAEAGLRLGLSLMFDAVEARRELVRALWQIPFLARLDEVEALPKLTLSLARRHFSAVVENQMLLGNIEASIFLLTTMVSNAIVYGVAARPHKLSRKEVEETLAAMLIRIVER
jgi:AcrR family transcriptional regulator